MFRILIVEDDQGTFTAQMNAISRAFTEADGELGVSIHIARSVSKGKQTIEEAHRNKRPYHAVILDAKLPPEDGYPTQVDESLCLLIRDLMKSTLVAHVSMYGDDEKVKDHLRRIHQEQINPKSFALSKSATDAIELIKRLRSFLYSMRVEEQMNSLFGQQVDLSFADKGRGRATAQRSRIERDSTLDLATLRRDIVAHWADLDERLKERIRLVFRVDPNSTPVRISLVRSPDSPQGA
ncbi:MAG TPA: hypothetical protein VK582_06475 [Pyrinomonadaceae bacterium]|nr:hypothetical protein [Pyrinomonadaceae bacterium]